VSMQVIDATPIETGEAVVDADVVNIDQSLNPYIERRDALEAMVRRFAAFAPSACAVRVITPESKSKAVALVRKMKAERKDAVAFFRPVKQGIDHVKKTALAMEDHVLQLVDGPVAVLTSAVARYDADVAAEQARRRQQIIEIEAKRLREAQEADARDRQERQLLDASLADVFGEEPTPVIVDDVAPPLTHDEAIELAAATAPAEPEPEKVDGMHYVDWPHYEVTDILALCKGVVDGIVPPDCVTFVAGALWRDVQKMKTDLGYPGVRVWTTKEPRTRAAASTAETEV
jgi:hypothetical protein